MLVRECRSQGCDRQAYREDRYLLLGTPLRCSSSTAPRQLLLGNSSCIALLPSIHGHMQYLHFHHPCRSYSRRLTDEHVGYPTFALVTINVEGINDRTIQVTQNLLRIIFDNNIIDPASIIMLCDPRFEGFERTPLFISRKTQCIVYC